MEPKISFIVPAFNFANYIESCVRSILSQTYSNIEVVVVNDGSTDNTEEVLDRLIIQDRRVIAVNKENEGVSVARNVGIKKCNGDYCVFVDADDYLAPDYAEYMMRLVNRTQGDFCLSLNCFTKNGERQIDDDLIKIYSPEEATALLLSPRVIVGSWNKIFKKQFLIENDLWFSSELFYGEGLRFITSAAQCSSCVGVGRRKVYYYRRNNYASATSKFNIEKLKNGLKSIEEIKENLRYSGENLMEMWAWHKCQFCMGAVVRIASANKQGEFTDFYRENLRYVRHNALKFLGVKNIPIYNKALLIGCAISPELMAKLDDWRRKRIAKDSVSEYGK